MIVMQFWLNLCYCSVAATSPILHPEPFAGNALLLISIDHPHVAGSVHDDDDDDDDDDGDDDDIARADRRDIDIASRGKIIIDMRMAMITSITINDQ